MKVLDINTARSILLKIFSDALSAVRGDHCVAGFLRAHPPAPDRPLRVVALGKAAASMLEGVQAVCATRIEAALLISKYQHIDPARFPHLPVVICEAGHPYPDLNSLAAGQRLLDFLAATRVPEQLLVLVSGGASSLVEVLPDGVTLEQLARMNHWLLASGLAINRMNQVRRSVSCIKGGRLAQQLGDYPVTQLLISDVPDDDPAVIGSGLLVPQSAQAAHMALPDWLQAMLDRAPPMPPPDATCFRRITTHIVATNALLRAQALEIAQAHGLAIRCNDAIGGDAAEQGQRMAACLREGPPGLYIWGGETVVRLPAAPGQGGRCQHLALTAACALAGIANVALLAAGSDGTDGPGDVAGALIDGSSVQRGRDAGFDERVALAQADSGRFLAASGDLLDTGPTGSNVMDLILAVKY